MPETPVPGRDTFGQRARAARERRGLTRAVAGGLVDRSADWVKSVESGKIGIPRWPLLLQYANVLGVHDLADLLGDERLSAASYAKNAHPDLAEVRKALTAYELARGEEPPRPVAELSSRVRRAWALWHAEGKHRSRIAPLLPELLRDLSHAARSYDGAERRAVLAELVQAYHLAQLYLSFQPVPELVHLTGDRAMTAAQEADDPHAIAGAAWYMNHVFRDAGERHEARVELAQDAANLLDRERGEEDTARWGLLQLACALSYAKVGRRGDAERHWDLADDAARRLGGGYTHPFLIFGRGMVDAYAITMQNDLMRGHAGTEAAKAVDIGAMPSATRRSFHLIEYARAQSLAGEPVATVHLLKKAYKESRETVSFNLFTRAEVAQLEKTGPKAVRDDARELRLSIGAPAAA